MAMWFTYADGGREVMKVVLDDGTENFEVLSETDQPDGTVLNPGTLTVAGPPAARPAGPPQYHDYSATTPYGPGPPAPYPSPGSTGPGQVQRIPKGLGALGQKYALAAPASIGDVKSPPGPFAIWRKPNPDQPFQWTDPWGAPYNLRDVLDRSPGAEEALGRWERNPWHEVSIHPSWAASQAEQAGDIEALRRLDPARAREVESHQRPRAAPLPADRDIKAIIEEAVRGGAERWLVEKAKAEQEMALARNTDERAAALLKVQQADQKLRIARAMGSTEEGYPTEERRQFDVSQLSTTGRALLDAATRLRGPEDYYQFQTNVAGGRNLMALLRGAVGQPAFSAPSGFTSPASVSALTERLGLSAPGGTGAGGGAGLYPLPHQINPAVWDTLGPVGRGLTRSAVEAGLTEGGAWDWDEYKRQIEATRPQGQIPSLTRQSWMQPQGVF